MSEKLIVRMPSGPLKGDIHLPASKSVSNRVLIIRALCGYDFPLENLSHADDTVRMNSCIAFGAEDEYCGDGGTTFRFLLALRALQGKIGTLSADGRMLERPVEPLVNALNALGAEITYTKGQGRASVRFSGRPLKGGEITVPANISSQFLSALMLIGPYLPGGLKIILEGNLVSAPYINMTAVLMREFGSVVVHENNSIEIPEGCYIPKQFYVPPDWSAAAVFYAIAALRSGSRIVLHDLAIDHYQGDRALASFMQHWGVESSTDGNDIVITSFGFTNDFIETDFSSNPDLAQVFAVMAAVSGRSFRLTGLSTLRNKETDRIHALAIELEKAGADIKEGSDFLEVRSGISPAVIGSSHLYSHGDHRMVMALSLLALSEAEVSLDEVACVSKSFPGYFEQLSRLS